MDNKEYYPYIINWIYYNYSNERCVLRQLLVVDRCTQAYAYNMLNEDVRNDMKLIEDINIKQLKLPEVINNGLLY